MNSFPERRARLAQALQDAGGGVAVIPTAPERQRNSDNDHPYRHDSSFHYLTGFDEPQAWLVLAGSGESTLLCREKDPAMEIWDGLRLGPAAAPGLSRGTAAWTCRCRPAPARLAARRTPSGSGTNCRAGTDRKSTRLNSSHG